MTYTAILTTDIQSTNGIHLPYQVIWSFSVVGLSIDFRPDPDGWRFGNAEGIDFSVDPIDFSNAVMWPESWWQQFDYSADIYPVGEFFCQKNFLLL